MASPLRITAGGFTADDFERYINLRFGTGDPIYFYAVGDATSFPQGQVLWRNEGCDMGRIHSFDREKGEAIGLTRKLIVMRDPASGELIHGPDGQPAWMSDFTYQLFTMRLENGFVTYESEQGVGDTFGTAAGGVNRSEIQKFAGMNVYTLPINYTLPAISGAEGPEPVWEVYDFIERAHEGATEYDALWSGHFPLPPFMGGGSSSMHAYFHRYDSYEELPETMRAFIEEYAPLWKAPPENLEEIRELQKG